MKVFNQNPFRSSINKGNAKSPSLLIILMSINMITLMRRTLKFNHSNVSPIALSNSTIT